MVLRIQTDYFIARMPACSQRLQAPEKNCWRGRHVAVEVLRTEAPAMVGGRAIPESSMADGIAGAATRRIQIRHHVHDSQAHSDLRTALCEANPQITHYT